MSARHEAPLPLAPHNATKAIKMLVTKNKPIPTKVWVGLDVIVWALAWASAF